jgi:cation diffusion facilitator CzcD-associated flavoprotein CzcO
VTFLVSCETPNYTIDVCAPIDWRALTMYEAHSYQYTFAPNKAWSGFYAPAEEICEYIDSVATKYGAKRYIHLQHKVTSSIWDDIAKKW